MLVLSTLLQYPRTRYIMSLPGGLAIDASTAGGPARFINHSCQPNCVAQRWQVAGRYRVGIFAAQEIQAGEEITFSYSNRGQSSSHACHCGTPVCSGSIWQPPKRQHKKAASQARVLKGLRLFQKVFVFFKKERTASDAPESQ